MPYYKIKRQPTGSKATAWKWFSKYIRLRDALATTGTPDYAKCITCNAILPIKNMQAGHMIPRRTGGILFDESMVFAQCKDCNETGNGERQKYKQIMVERNGLEWYEAKERAQKGNNPLGKFACSLLVDLYREKYNQLVKLCVITNLLENEK